MRCSFLALIRLTGLAALGLGVVTVTVGRLVPPEAKLRRLAPPAVVPVNSYACGLTNPGAFLVESGTSRLVRFDAEDGTVDQATCAPWRDASGGTQIAGRWIRRGESAELGVARLAFPGGQVIDRIATRVPPTGPVCWMPGTDARVLFAAGDGRLYRLDFESNRKPREPVPLGWRRADARLRHARISDPSWPVNPRAGDCLLVTLNRLVPRGDRTRYSPSQVWWLRLDPSGSAVVNAGPVTNDETAGHRRFPTLISDGRGGLQLLTLARHEGESGWSLLIEAVRMDPDPRTPGAVPGSARTLARDLCPTPLAVARDGSAVTVIQRTRTAGRPVRIVLRPADAAGPGAAQVVGAASSDSRRHPDASRTGGSSQRTLGSTRGA